MRLIAKVDTEWDFKSDDISECIQENRAIEIQMLGDITKGYKKCIEVIEKLRKYKVDYVVIHLPMGEHELGYISCNLTLDIKFRLMIMNLIRYSKDSGIGIDVLVHVEDKYEKLVGVGAIGYLKSIAERCKGTSVGIILENKIRSSTLGDGEKTSLEQIFKVIDNDSIKMCLDICHIQASENLYDKDIELTEDQIRNIKNIHFSYTVDGDGYRDKRRTHGRAHLSIEDVLLDLDYLEAKGIDLSRVNIVLEINEEDYTSRKDLIKEIKLVKQAIKLKITMGD